MNNELLTVLRDVNSPPGGWKYTVPQTGVTITAQFWNGLLPQILQHLRANGVEITDELLLEIEDGACRETNPPGWCRKRQPKPVAGQLPHLTLGMAEQFIKTVWEVIKERKLVDRAEAERRLAICMSCPLATSIGGCEGCTTLYKKMVEMLATKNPLTVETGKEFCGACGCLLLAKTAIPNATLDRAEGSTKPRYLEGHCWRLEK
jgi:hypothetical protein